jgi:two-component system sensor histidine kinase CpxA
MPHLAEQGVALTVAREDGSPHLRIVPPRVPPESAPAPDAGVVAEILSRGEKVEWRRGGGLSAGLPIRLPSGERAVFYVSGRHARWGEREGWRALPGLALILGVAWLLCWPLASHLANPLRRLAATADALGRGDLSARIALRRRDEIGTLARRFNAMAENLQRLVARHKQLLADISHELRSPLARMRVALELARAEGGPSAAPYLDTMGRQADALEGLIEELLAYSRLDATPQEPAREQFRVQALLEEVMAAHAAQADAKRIRIDSAVEGALEPLWAERRLLARALGNVLGNALAHAPEGSAISIRASAEPGAVLLAVRDEGPGVEPALLERIFEPFVRADAARGRESGGVGLGLAIARRALEAHGGAAWAENNPGRRGLTVKLWLPAPEGGQQ